MPSEALFALRTASPHHANGLNAQNGFRPFFFRNRYKTENRRIRSRPHIAFSF
ncbi:TPA: hypothetical protein ACLBBE_000297 [Neisseria meningitidis]